MRAKTELGRGEWATLRGPDEVLEREKKGSQWHCSDNTDTTFYVRLDFPVQFCYRESETLGPCVRFDTEAEAGCDVVNWDLPWIYSKQ
jgi:hypothetical protein